MTDRTAGNLAIAIGGVAAVALLLALKYTAVQPRALLKTLIYASIALVWLGGVWRRRRRGKPRPTRVDGEMPAPLCELLLERLHAAIALRVDADSYSSDGRFAEQVRNLPRGLRAMAATHYLDVSLTLDDLGWHFLNFGEVNHVSETEAGLRELGLAEMADVFREAHMVLRPHLARLVEQDCDYYDYIEETGLEPRLGELARKAWALHKTDEGPRAIYAAWCRYARAHPEVSGFDRPWPEIEASLKREQQEKTADARDGASHGK